MAHYKSPEVPDEFSWDEELERVLWFKDDLKKGGWRKMKSFPGAIYHMKVFKDEPCPLKCLLEWDLPIPAEIAFNACYVNLEERSTWDNEFPGTKFLETKEDGGRVVYSEKENPWPIATRGFMMLLRTKAFTDPKYWLASYRNATHPSVPADGDVIRVINGNNFNYIIEDEEKPDEACKLFALSCNDYGGWLPKLSMFFWGELLINILERQRHNILKANAEKYFDKYR